jgi:hypothetical protein
MTPPGHVVGSGTGMDAMPENAWPAFAEIYLP